MKPVEVLIVAAYDHCRSTANCFLMSVAEATTRAWTASKILISGVRTSWSRGVRDDQEFGG